MSPVSQCFRKGSSPERATPRRSKVSTGFELETFGRGHDAVGKRVARIHIRARSARGLRFSSIFNSTVQTDTILPNCSLTVWQPRVIPIPVIPHGILCSAPGYESGLPSFLRPLASYPHLHLPQISFGQKKSRRPRHNMDHRQ